MLLPLPCVPMDHEADYARLVAELEVAGLVTLGGDAVAMSEPGKQLVRQLAMSGEDDRDVLMEGSLDALVRHRRGSSAGLDSRSRGESRRRGG